MTKIDLVSAGYFLSKREKKQANKDNRALNGIVFIILQV